MRDKLFRFAMAGMSAATWTLITAGVITGYLNWAKYEPAFEVINPESHSVKMDGPRHVVIHREFRIHREREFLFIRELVRGMDGNAVLRVELPTTVVEYPPGDYKTDRVQEVPPLKPGTYSMTNRVCWKPNIIKTECVNLPRLDLVVSKLEE
jgi:hypothetical protein